MQTVKCNIINEFHSLDREYCRPCLHYDLQKQKRVVLLAYLQYGVQDIGFIKRKNTRTLIDLGSDVSWGSTETQA